MEKSSNSCYLLNSTCFIELIMKIGSNSVYNIVSLYFSILIASLINFISEFVSFFDKPDWMKTIIDQSKCQIYHS